MRGRGEVSPEEEVRGATCRAHISDAILLSTIDCVEEV